MRFTKLLTNQYISIAREPIKPMGKKVPSGKPRPHFKSDIEKQIYQDAAKHKADNVSLIFFRIFLNCLKRSIGTARRTCATTTRLKWLNNSGIMTRVSLTMTAISPWIIVLPPQSTMSAT